MKKTVPKPCFFIIFYFQNKKDFICNFIVFNLLWKQNYLKPGLTVYKQISRYIQYIDKY